MGKLTVTQIKRVKYESKSYKLADGGGLYLHVTKSGKYWRYDYRFKKKRKTLTIGPFPEVSLATARDKHFEARQQLFQEIDPGVEKQMIKQEANGLPHNCFDQFAWEWFEKQNQRWTHGHSRTVKARLEQHILPWIGELAVDKITPKEVLDVCRRIEKRANFETAHRVKSICSQVFRYCVAIGECESDPCRDLRNALTPSKPKNMPAIIEPKRVGELMRAIEEYRGSDITRYALQFASLVFVRPGELRYAEWSEVDVSQGLWKIPAEKMKKRQTHLVPLSKQAIRVLGKVNRFTYGCRYIFPSMRSVTRPMSDNTLLSALRTLGFGKDEMTVHGFRGMASTLLHENGWRSELIEKQLAHSDRNSVRAAYNHAEYLEERRKMMQFWADYLDELRGGN